MTKKVKYTAHTISKLTKQLNKRIVQVKEDLRKAKRKKWKNEHDIDQLIKYHTKIQTTYQKHEHNLEVLEGQEAFSSKLQYQVETLHSQILLYLGVVELLQTTLEKHKDKHSLSRLVDFEDNSCDWISDWGEWLPNA